MAKLKLPTGRESKHVRVSKESYAGILAWARETNRSLGNIVDAAIAFALSNRKDVEKAIYEKALRAK